MNNSPGLAVVIPTLNEECSLAATLDSLTAQSEPAIRIIVADGESSDDTTTVAKNHGACVIVTPRKGRGCQIAAALMHLDEEIVLIVHADMIVPATALAQIRSRLAEDAACPGGCLGHRFDSPRRIYRWVEWWDQRRAWRGMSYGDQGQFFRRELLERCGGFPDQPIMEDVELSRRLSRIGRPAYLDCPVIVSARRFKRLGWRRVVFRNWLFRLAYRLGGPRVCAPIYRRYYEDSCGREQLVVEAARSASDGVGIRSAMHSFEVGERVRTMGHWEFADGIVGTVTGPEPFQLDLAKPGEWQGHRRTVQGRTGLITFYFVRFDRAADDGSGDGPYYAAEIEADCLAPADA